MSLHFILSLPSIYCLEKHIEEVGMLYPWKSATGKFHLFICSFLSVKGKHLIGRISFHCVRRPHKAKFFLLNVQKSTFHSLKGHHLWHSRFNTLSNTTNTSATCSLKFKDLCHWKLWNSNKVSLGRGGCTKTPQNPGIAKKGGEGGVAPLPRFVRWIWHIVLRST